MKAWALWPGECARAFSRTIRARCRGLAVGGTRSPQAPHGRTSGRAIADNRPGLCSGYFRTAKFSTVRGVSSCAGNCGHSCTTKLGSPELLRLSQWTSLRDRNPHHNHTPDFYHTTDIEESFSSALVRPSVVYWLPAMENFGL